MIRKILLVLLVLLGTSCSKAEQQRPSKTFDPGYQDLATVLSEYVVGENVDYAALKLNRATLDSFIDQLAGLTSEEFEAMSRPEQLALWINAYNGITLRSIVDAYPVESIKDIDGVWTYRKWRVAGRNVTLDHIEHKILRPDFRDGRVHFAVNCASIGCPPLLNEPFQAATLEAQLARVSRDFVNHATRNSVDAGQKKVSTSEIFSWFGEDFEDVYDGSERFGHLESKEASTLQFLYDHADSAMAATLDSVEDWKLEYLPYDWSLNDVSK